MASNRTRCVVVLLIAALLIGACGGDDEAATTTSDSSTTSTERDADENTTTSDADRDDYVAAMTNELVATSAVDVEMDHESASCVAAALIDAAGMESLQSAGIAPEAFAEADSFADLGIDLSDADVGRLSEEMNACLDFRELFVNSSPDSYACLVDGIEPSSISRLLAVEFATGMGTDLFVEMVASAESECAEHVFLSGFVERGHLNEEQADCVAEVIDDEVAHRALLASANPEGPVDEDVLIFGNAFAECGVQR